MKMKDVFIGQIVVNGKPEDWSNPYFPEVGKVVDIAYEYQPITLYASNNDRPVRVLPVVHFLTENQPRTINPCNIEVYKGENS